MRFSWLLLLLVALPLASAQTDIIKTVDVNRAEGLTQEARGNCFVSLVGGLTSWEGLIGVVSVTAFIILNIVTQGALVYLAIEIFDNVPAWMKLILGFATFAGILTLFQNLWCTIFGSFLVMPIVNLLDPSIYFFTALIIVAWEVLVYVKNL